MRGTFDPFRLLLVSVAGWSGQQQRDAIDYLRKENQVLRETPALPIIVSMSPPGYPSLSPTEGTQEATFRIFTSHGHWRSPNRLTGFARKPLAVKLPTGNEYPGAKASSA